MKYLKYIEEWKYSTTIEFQKISLTLSEDDAITVIQKNCKEFLKNPKYITRGIRKDFEGKNWINSDYFYSNPSTLNRKSADCYNYYTLVIDNDPSWKEFPKRHKSFICTLGQTHMKDNVYYVIPEDGSKWGVCNEYDIYLGFNKQYVANSFTHDLSKFYTYIMNINNDKINILSDDDYLTFIDDLNKLNEKLKSMTGSEIIGELKKNLYLTNHFKSIIKNNVGEYYKTIEQPLKWYNGWKGDMVKIVKDYVSPNNFKVQTYEELENISYKFDKESKRFLKTVNENEKEIWTDSPCVFIHKRNINDILKKLF